MINEPKKSKGIFDFSNEIKEPLFENILINLISRYCETNKKI